MTSQEWINLMVVNMLVGTIWIRCSRTRTADTYADHLIASAIVASVLGWVFL